MCKNSKKLKRRDGFTLVELLIVIVIIGILAGMTMIVTGGATDKAEAIRIVNNLRSVKTAALLYYNDHGTWPAPDDSGAWTASIEAYMDRSLDTGAIGGIKIFTPNGGSRVFIGFSNIANAADGVGEKLAGMAREAGIYGSGGTEYDGTTNPNEAYVTMK